VSDKPADPRLARARQELAAAALLAANGFTAQAVSRACYAAFYAAEAALFDLGETRAKHSGVIAAFGQLLVRDGHLDQDVGRLLRSLFSRRSQADYLTEAVPTEEADQAIADAATVVSAVESWLGRSA